MILIINLWTELLSRSAVFHEVTVLRRRQQREDDDSIDKTTAILQPSTRSVPLVRRSMGPAGGGMVLPIHLSPEEVVNGQHKCLVVANRARIECITMELLCMIPAKSSSLSAGRIACCANCLYV